jgi:hypothetical protein
MCLKIFWSINFMFESCHSSEIEGTSNLRHDETTLDEMLLDIMPNVSTYDGSYHERILLDDAIDAARSECIEDRFTVLCFYVDGNGVNGDQGKAIGTKSIFWYEASESDLLAKFLARRYHWGTPDENGRYVDIKVFGGDGSDETIKLFSAATAYTSELDKILTPWKSSGILY